ncbi:DUF6152 family protein [Alteraurantiacibacter buctensis]|uniref:Copper-binding protein n=1 Tax=Alteraurantiacibacter buctensis TaxID=1503981 RepID=A0A844Z0N3_9SPHN|nr:DUF6152 family protein [Alteraurantiacibacter buctensis]MXO72541.1 hypothetical protein [Alteraurantiacibacter buctensis]
MTRILAAALAVAGAGTAAILAAPVVAHHSFAMFNQREIMTVEGTVREFQWTNPHAFIELEERHGNSTRTWSIELNSPNNLTRQGWRRTSLRPGDRISLRMNPLRNGEHGGLFLDLRKADGTVLDSGLPKNGQPINVPNF